MKAPIRIGTRGSELALWQARRVGSLLADMGEATPEVVIVQTAGDRDRSRALHELEGFGFFTKELQDALLDHRVDLVVHSLKDLAIAEPDGLALGAVLLREDPSDLLLARMESVGDGGLGLARNARLGTSSLRRVAQALDLQPDVQIAPLRGNVPTRVQRLREGDFDAILLASAGVRRLGCDLAGLAVTRLPLDRFLPAAGQGALAIEVRSDDRDAVAIAARLHDPSVAEAVSCERAVLAGLGGGCHLPLGVFARREVALIRVDAALGDVDAAATRATVRRASATAASGDEAALAVLRILRDRALT